MTRPTQRLLAFLAFTLTLLPNALLAQDFEWMEHYVGVNNAVPTAVAVDHQGNVVTVGKFSGTMDVDPGPGVTTLNATISGENTFIQKLDPNGNLIWGYALNNSIGHNGAYAVEIDPADNIYIAGWTLGSVDLNPGVGIDSFGTSIWGAYLLRLNAGGEFIRGGFIENALLQYENGSVMALDTAANIYLIAQFMDSVDLDLGQGSSTLNVQGYEDSFIAMYDSNFALQWDVPISSFGQELGFAITANASGCYATGRLNAPTDFDPGPGTTLLNVDTAICGFIAHYSPLGALVWTEEIVAQDGDVFIFSIAEDNAGNLTMTGVCSTNSSPIDLDPTAGVHLAPTSNGDNMFAVRLNASGGFLWAWYAGSADLDQSRNVTVDDQGNAYLSTLFSAAIDMDPGPGTAILTVSPAQMRDVALVKLDPQGAFVGVSELEGMAMEYLADASIGADSSIHCVGIFQATVDFDPSPADTFLVTAVHNTDGFLLKLSQNPCTDLSIRFDSVGTVTCAAQSAFLQGHAANGNAPYAYVWNTFPPTMDSVATTTAPGAFTLQVTDTIGCQAQRTIMVSGYTLPNAFDLQVNLVAGPFREAINTQIVLDAFNAGCTPVSGQAKLVLDPQVTYQSAAPTPDAIIGDTLFWNLPSMNFDSGHFVAHVQVVTDTSVALGDSLYFDAIVTPTVGDAQPLNNTRLDYVFPVLMSLDPNLIDVYPPGACEDRYVVRNEPLTYTVHFQNTGNAEALDVMVEDSLDPNLDPMSLSIKGSSHSMITEMLPGGVVRFIFNDIHLPDSASNPSGSQGYVIYELLPVSNIPSGTVISAEVGIFFDFNPAVITNTVTNTLVDLIPPCSVVMLPDANPQSFTLAPNPASSTAILTSNAPLIGVTVYNMLGQAIFANPDIQDHQLQLDLHGWPKGIYLLHTAASPQCLRLVVE